MTVTAAVISIVTASFMVLGNLGFLVWGAAKLTATVGVIDKSMEDLVRALGKLEERFHVLDVRVSRLEERTDGRDRFLGS